MSGEQEEKGFETLGEIASRVLGGVVEKAKKNSDNPDKPRVRKPGRSRPLGVPANDNADWWEEWK